MWQRAVIQNHWTDTNHSVTFCHHHVGFVKLSERSGITFSWSQSLTKPNAKRSNTQL